MEEVKSKGEEDKSKGEEDDDMEEGETNEPSTSAGVMKAGRTKITLLRIWEVVMALWVVVVAMKKKKTAVVVVKEEGKFHERSHLRSQGTMAR
jgi:hypothetical protein